MNKKILWVVVLLIVLICPACKKTKNKNDLPTYMKIDVWDGQTSLGDFFYGPPVSIVWSKGKDKPHKGFCHAKEILEIIDLLMSPEIKTQVQLPPPKLMTYNCDVMYFFYLPNEGISSHIVAFNFSIGEDGIFVGPSGKSKQLGMLLLEKEESGLERYFGYRYPYDEERIERDRANSKLYREEVLKRKQECEK